MLIALSLINLSTVELLITITTKKLSTSLDIVIYPTRGDLSYSRSFLLGGVGIVGYRPPGYLLCSYLPSLGPPSEVLYRALIPELIRTLFKKFFYYFFSENWVFIFPHYIGGFYNVGVKTFHFGNK